ncbi:MAG: cytochrome c1 [Pseudomonadota bacterium]
MIFKRLLLAATIALTTAGGAFAAGKEAAPIENIKFPYDGIFGRFDQAQLQRGLQVYTQVCAGCHGLQYVAFRTLSDPQGPALSEEQLKAYLENFEIYDETIDDFRVATPADHFPGSAVENAPDLTLMAKARGVYHDGIGFTKLVNGIGGPEYIAQLLQSYTDEIKEEAGAVLYQNKSYPGEWIAMGQPLWGDDVEYTDGTEATIQQQAEDVAAFLMWTAEPGLMARKTWGLIMVGLLGVLAVLLFLTNKALWRDVKYSDE